MFKTNQEIIQTAARIVPSHRQLLWQDTDFYALLHFGLNTFEGKDIGDGKTEPKAFFPMNYDPRQIVRICKASGMKGLILTCKNHDGFCLWPSKYTEYSVKNSQFQNGHADIVRDISALCQESGLKFGVYFSLWDQHEPTYGSGTEYDTFLVNQLTELLSSYGDIFEVWLDSACMNSKPQAYNYALYSDTIRRLQPNAVIAGTGSDIRDLGNGRGISRPSEWSVIGCDRSFPSCTPINESKKMKQKKVTSAMNLDLGSRKAIKDAPALCWYPAEMSVCLRDHKFYRKEDDVNIKSLEKIKNFYWNSVGANSALMLSMAVDRCGMIPPSDAEVLQALGIDLDMIFANPVSGIQIQASSEKDKAHGIQNTLEQNDSYYCSAAGAEAIRIRMNFEKEEDIRTIVLEENITTGQQIESFKIEYLQKNKWKTLDHYTVIGHKKIIRLKRPVRTSGLQIVITSFRSFATLKKIEIYI